MVAGLPAFWAEAPGVSALDQGLAPGYAIAWVTWGGQLMVASPWWAAPRILASDCGTFEFAWSADATYLTYLAGPEPGQAERFCRVPVDGGAPVEIPGFPPLATALLPGSSPDGAFSMVQLTETGIPYFSLAIVGPGLAEPLILQAYGYWAWSPDSRVLAYGKPVDVGQLAGVSDLSLSSSLCLHNMETGAETILVDGDPMNLYYAHSWPQAGELHYTQEESPAGRQSMYYDWVVDPAGGQPQCLGGDVGTYLGDTEVVPEVLRPFGDPWAESSPDQSAAIVGCFDTTSGVGERDFVVVLDPETGAWGLLGEGFRAVWSPVPVPESTAGDG